MAEHSAFILIVDDDPAVSDTLLQTIKSINMNADTAFSGEEALEKLKKTTFDLILMDINMHGKDGFETIADLRKMNITTPVIIVSGRKDDYDTLYGLDIGADDYITKPFNPVTLGAKVKAILRRSKQHNGDLGQDISAGPFIFNTASLVLTKNGNKIMLTPKETNIMRLFIDNVNRVLPKDMLYEIVWDTAAVDESALLVYINRLRQKIEDDPASPRFIQTVRKIGYRFVI